MIKCKSTALKKFNLDKDFKLIAGCELTVGSAFIKGNEVGSCSIGGNNTKEECIEAGGEWTVTCEGGMEVFAPVFIGEDDMCSYVGENGATVLWPDIGNNLYSFSEGESIPIGTQIIDGQVFEDGNWFGPPHQTEDEEAVAGEDGATGYVPEDADRGWCDDWGFDPLTDDDKDWLAELANLEIPDIKAFALSGFMAAITKLMSKLGAALGKLQVEVDQLMDKVKLNPEDICTPEVKKAIAKMMAVMKRLMKIMPILKRILRIVKIIGKVLKIVKKVLKYATFPVPVVAVVEKLLQLLNIIGLVDMAVSVLLSTVGRFTAIIPILQAQLMAILAACAQQAGQKPPTNKEECEALGGVWVDPQELKELEDLLRKMSEEAQGMYDDSADTVGFCSIPEHPSKSECEAAGGTWNTVDTSTEPEDVDVSTLEDELSKQLQELSRCFQDPELDDYLRSL